MWPGYPINVDIIGRRISKKLCQSHWNCSARVGWDFIILAIERGIFNKSMLYTRRRPYSDFWITCQIIDSLKCCLSVALYCGFLRVVTFGQSRGFSARNTFQGQDCPDAILIILRLNNKKWIFQIFSQMSSRETFKLSRMILHTLRDRHRCLLIGNFKKIQGIINELLPASERIHKFSNKDTTVRN